jgi:hypothetical protein
LCLEKFALAVAARSKVHKQFGDEQATNNNIEDYLGDAIIFKQTHSNYLACQGLFCRGYTNNNTLPEWGIQASYLGCFLAVRFLIPLTANLTP